MGESHGRPRVNAARSLVFFVATPTLLCRQPMTAPDDAPKVVFTHSRFHMAARLENMFEHDFLFQKNGRCGMGWDSVSSLQSFIETEDGSVYKFTSKLPLHSVATQDKITMKINQLNILHECHATFPTFASV